MIKVAGSSSRSEGPCSPSGGAVDGPPVWRRLGRVFAWIAGALPLVVATWLHDLVMVAYSQVGGWRTWGLLGVLALTTGAIALAAAGLGVLLGLDRASPGLGRWLRGAFCLAVALNVAALGARIFHPIMDAGAFYFLLAFPLLAAGVAYARHPEADRAVIAWALGRLGLAALLLPVLAAPGVAWAYQDYQRERPHAQQRLGAAAVAPGAPKRIIVVTFDALRYRSTSFAAPERHLTPAWRALAAEGTWFANCRSAGDRTLLSVPTVLTGVRPSDFYESVDNGGGYLRTGLLPGLGGLLAPAGYRSYYATMLIAPTHIGLSREFRAGGVLNPLFEPMPFTDAEFLPLHGATEWTLMRHAASVAPTHPVAATRATFDHALALLKGETGRTFIWVHVGAPHTPYFEVPPGDLGGELHPERYARASEPEVRNADAAALPRYLRMYESYVRFADAEFGRFMSRLEAEGLLDEALVVATADHGEGLSGTARLHGDASLGDEVTHVPLVIRPPGRRATHRVDAPASHEDIVPTILARVYAHVPCALIGRDLLATRPAASRTTYTWAIASRQAPRPSVAAFQERFEFISNGVDGHEHLYDLAADPLERHDLSQAQPGVLSSLRTQAHRDITW